MHRRYAPAPAACRRRDAPNIGRAIYRHRARRGQGDDGLLTRNALLVLRPAGSAQAILEGPAQWLPVNKSAKKTGHYQAPRQPRGPVVLIVLIDSLFRVLIPPIEHVLLHRPGGLLQSYQREAAQSGFTGSRWEKRTPLRQWLLVASLPTISSNSARWLFCISARILWSVGIGSPDRNSPTFSCSKGLSTKVRVILLNTS